MASVSSQKKLRASIKKQTETPGNLTQGRWQGTDSWGQLSGKEPNIDAKVSPTRVIWPYAATKVGESLSGGAMQPEMSRHPLVVIIPLAAVFLFFETVSLYNHDVQMYHIA